MMKTLIILILLSFSANAHHGKPDKYFDCVLIARGILNGNFAGGDGKFGSEDGNFKADYLNDSKNKGTGATLIIHGDRFVGGEMNLRWNGSTKSWIYAPILDENNLKNMPYNYLKDNKDIDNTILWLSAFRSHYKESVFMTFVRGTLRYSSFGNHPTRAVATGEHGFLDCKKRK